LRWHGFGLLRRNADIGATKRSAAACVNSRLPGAAAAGFHIPLFHAEKKQNRLFRALREGKTPV
jgi:hypothetical protein